MKFTEFYHKKTVDPKKEYEHRYLTIQINNQTILAETIWPYAPTSCSPAPHNENTFTSSYHFLAYYTGKGLTH